MAALDDLKAYLTGSFLVPADYSDAVLTAVLATEAAAQAKAVTYPTEVPPNLTEALYRRCARNLRMRQHVLGLNDTDTGSTYISAKDPEIKRLEAPYRKILVG